MRKIKLFLVLIICYSSVSSADNCVNKNGKNICNIAKALASGMADDFPQKISSKLTFESAFSFKNLVQIVARFSYDKKYLNELYESKGLSIEKYKENLKKSLDGMCVGDSAVSKFIKMGGEIQYVYKFNDNEYFMAVGKYECP